MADNWEDDDIEVESAVAVSSVTVPVAARKWDDEDASDDEVKDSWDASGDEESDEDKQKAASTGVAAPIRKKVPLAARIAQREAEKQEQRALLASQKLTASGAAIEETEEEIVERRQRELRLQQQSDLENAADLFADVADITNTASPGGFIVPAAAAVPVDDPLVSMIPKTKDEFDVFQRLLTDRITPFNTSRYYPSLILALVTSLAAPMKDVDVRKLASTLTASANEKTRLAKEKEKGKKSKASSKPSVVAIKSTTDLDTTDYGTGGAYAEDDYDDFM